MNPLLYVDSYKTQHHRMYPEGTTMIYSNLTPRKSRMQGVNEVVVFGIQHFIIKYLLGKFEDNFFRRNEINRAAWDDAYAELSEGEKLSDARIKEFEGSYSDQVKKQIIEEYKRHTGVTDTTHIEKLWDLGYLPIEIKALEEGTRCPIGVPCMTIKNTHPDFAWLVNYLETLISCQVWQAMTSATIAYEYKKILTKYALETTGSSEFVQWQGHDFSMRGMSSVESAILSGMSHLLSFTGTDTIPAIYALESSYDAIGLIGASVPATEHSVESMGAQGTMEGEYEHTKRLLKLFPTGIVSKVSDTTDLWSYITKVLPRVKSEVMSRDGKLVVRPDSGNPVDIICGKQYAPYNNANFETYAEYKLEHTRLGQSVCSEAEFKGVIELLWEIFGGTINEFGYKVLDPHIGAIYGDSITLDRAKDICERLKDKGFASTNIVLGIGSYTYQYNTRDTFGFAVKATYGEVLPDCTSCEGTEGGCKGWCTKPEAREIFKDPITDDGTKKSKKGLLCVYEDEPSAGQVGHIIVKDQCSWDSEREGMLQTVFLNGKLIKKTTLEEIRSKLTV